MENLLFDDLKPKPAKSQSLQVAEQPGSSKVQLQFNKLVAKVSVLETKLTETEQKMERLLRSFNQECQPLQRMLEDVKITFAFAINEKSEALKFSKKTSKQIGTIIGSFLKDVLRDRQPTEKEEALYDKWAPQSYKDSIDEVNDMGKSFISSMIKERFGVDLDLDLSGINFNDDESMAQFMAQTEEKLQKKLVGENPAPDNKKKAARQLAKEEKEKKEEELKSKSVRGIYISLSKILHPDLEQDISLKAEKEETMKQVTAAYDSNDLAKLLQLEMEWIHKTSESVSQISEQKLKAYISILKERVSELQDYITDIAYNPRFEEISLFANYKENTALKELNALAKDLQEDIENESKNLSNFKTITDKKAAVHFIETMFNYILSVESEEYYDFF